jgi:hypothetical protein
LIIASGGNAASLRQRRLLTAAAVWCLLLVRLLHLKLLLRELKGMSTAVAAAVAPLADVAAGRLAVSSAHGRNASSLLHCCLTGSRPWACTTRRV